MTIFGNKAELDGRACEILREIVQSYLETGEPVGSRNLSRRLPTSLSPATIRNVMSDLEQLNLIISPHISAGRIPTEQGLRFFVDGLMEVDCIAGEDKISIINRIEASAHSKDTQNLLTEAVSILSSMANGAGLVLSSTNNAPLKHIEFVPLDKKSALVVLVTENGEVENRVMDLPAGLPLSALVEATNYLNAHMCGYTLAQAQEKLSDLLAGQSAELDLLTQKLIESGIAIWAGSTEQRVPNLIVRGRANLLDDVKPEDLERIRLLFEDLENKKNLMNLLESAEKAEGVRIFIGSESKLFSLSGSSLIVAPYMDKGSQVVGVLGVIGPTRLNYSRIIPVVDFTAKLIGQLLESS